jgi:hypothetical protein
MPIRPENRLRYPKDWPSISQDVRQRAGNRCEECGVENHRLGGRSPDGRFWPAHPAGESSLGLMWPRPGEHSWCSGWPDQLKIIRIVLTVAHLDHQPENCAPKNLKALCQRCHLRLDAKSKAERRLARNREALACKELF